jgi:hypothetical protein
MQWRSSSSKRTRDKAPTAAKRLRAWRRFEGQVPELQRAALPLLSAHAMSAATLVTVGQDILRCTLIAGYAQRESFICNMCSRVSKSGSFKRVRDHF